MTNEIIISPAIPKDARGIQWVFYKTWLATYPNEQFGITLDDLEHRHKDKLTDEYIKGREKVIEEMTSDELFLVAKDNAEIIGVGYFTKKEKNQLQAMYILPEYQGKGIGKQLWKEAKEFFKPGQDVYVEVVEYNMNAINFYKSLGFVDTGKRFSDERFRMKSGAVFPEIEMVLKAGQF